MGVSTLRAGDMALERKIADYIDRRVYSNPFFANLRRCDDLDMQMRGIDLVVDTPSFGLRDMLVDEKCMGHYLRNPLPTFAFELEFLDRNGDTREGWLTDNHKLTQYYALEWLHADCDGCEDFDDSVVKGLRFAMVSRAKLLDFLDDKGFGRDWLRQLCRRLRNDSAGGSFGKDLNLGFWLYYTMNLAERPINIVFRRELLYSLAEFYFEIGE